jgi:hypothetical protein
MNLLLFRTDIKSKKRVKTIKPLLNNHPVIASWSVDTADIDNVLRIEAMDVLKEEEVIYLVRTCGFHCEVLPD